MLGYSELKWKVRKDDLGSVEEITEAFSWCISVNGYQCQDWTVWSFRHNRAWKKTQGERLADYFKQVRAFHSEKVEGGVSHTQSQWEWTKRERGKRKMIVRVATDPESASRQQNREGHCQDPLYKHNIHIYICYPDNHRGGEQHVTELSVLWVDLAGRSWTSNFALVCRSRTDSGSAEKGRIKNIKCSVKCT